MTERKIERERIDVREEEWMESVREKERERNREREKEREKERERERDKEIEREHCLMNGISQPLRESSIIKEIFIAGPAINKQHLHTRFAPWQGSHINNIKGN